jgi:tetratricopeptide (TPR) repeat protein
VKIKLFSLFFCFLLNACQKPGQPSLAADNLSPLAAPPMGARVYNDEFKKELSALDEILDQKADKKALAKSKELLLKAKVAPDFSPPQHDYFFRVLLTMPELIHLSAFSSQDKAWHKAKFYFLRRRFVESAMMLSDVLEKDPNFHEARNWRARAIFFLGNPSLALKELSLIVEKNKIGIARRDALYLMGAIVYEANDSDKDKLLLGTNAWLEYAKDPSLDEAAKKEVALGLQELSRRQKGELIKPIENTNDPFLPNERYAAEKNAILTAFMKEELLLAEELLEKAATNKQNDPELMVLKARILLKSGRPDEAMKLFSEASKRFKDYAPAFHYQGMAFMMTGKIKEAIASWQECSRLNQAYASHHRLSQRISVAESMLAPQKIESH